MVVIDASVWVSRFKENDAFHEQAQHIIRTLVSNQEKNSLPAIVFMEVTGAIKRASKDNDFARGAILFMKEMGPEIFVNFSELEPIATEIAINHNIRGADAYYLAVAKMTKSNLYTFDKQQKESFDVMSRTW